jgi:hypothetical protein
LNFLEEESYLAIRSLLLRVVCMLTKLVRIPPTRQMEKHPVV